MRRPGKIYKWTDKNGDIQTGIAFNDEQDLKKFAGRIWINVTDEQHNRKKDELTGKFIVSVKFLIDVKQIGFVD